MTIQPGQTYRSADPRELIRIRIVRYEQGWNRADVVDAVTGKRPRQIVVRNLHASATTKTGQPRRSGYVLEHPMTQPSPASTLRTAASFLRQPATTVASTMTPSAAALLRAREPLAQWLDTTASYADLVDSLAAAQGIDPAVEPGLIIHHALAVARAILGDQP